MMAAQTDRLILGEALRKPYAAGTAACEQRQAWALRAALIASDIVATAAAFCAAYVMRFQLGLTVAPEVVPPAEFYVRLALVLIPVWLLLFAVNGLYSPENLLRGTTEYARAFHASSVGLMLVVVATFLDPRFVISRGWLVSAWVLTVVLTCAARFVIRRLVYCLRRRGYFLVPALVVGSNGEAALLVDQLSDHRSAGYVVAGIVTVNPGDKTSGRTPAPVLGSAGDIVSIVNAYKVREVIVAASSMHREQLLAMFERLQPLDGVAVHISTGLYEVLTTGVQLKMAGTIPLVRLNRLRLEPVEAAVKTVFEYFVATLALLAGLPALIAIALLVKFTSPGPVFHRRRVLGVGGREFDAFKFRTMRVDGEMLLDRSPELKAKLREEGKLKDDPRVTPVGRLLRRYSLDELPQLLNVLRGEMSLVGPRMITAGEAVKYGEHRVNLLTVKPGITGLWQVSGRSELNYAQRVRLDMHYIRHYSIWRDIQILFVQTPGAVLRGRGAY